MDFSDQLTKLTISDNTILVIFTTVRDMLSIKSIVLVKLHTTSSPRS